MINSCSNKSPKKAKYIRFLLVTMFILPCVSVAKTSMLSGESMQVYGEVALKDSTEQMPTFPGNINSFLQDNIKYPNEAFSKNVEGKVVVDFVVDKDGSIINAKVIEGVEKSLDAEALRVVRLMPKWIPGRQKGELVKVRYFVPVVFRIPRIASMQESVVFKRDNKFEYSHRSKEDSLSAPPQFPGGVSALIDFIAKKTKYPKGSIENQTRGYYVEIGFTIDSNGEVQYPIIRRSLDKYIDAEAMRAIKSMPRWTPCKGIYGENIDSYVYFTIPFFPPNYKHEEVFEEYEEMASPPYNVNKFLQDNTHYPYSALSKGIDGDVTIGFIIDDRGKVRLSKIVKSANKYLDAEAVRAVMLMPDWSPARYYGRSIITKYDVTFKFRHLGKNVLSPTILTELEWADGDFSYMKNIELYLPIF